MLLNMVMFKVTICDFGKININMTDKIEKRRAGTQRRTFARKAYNDFNMRVAKLPMLGETTKNIDIQIIVFSDNAATQ